MAEKIRVVVYSPAVDLAELRTLALRGNGPDRAFVDGVVRMRWSRSQDPVEQEELQGLVRAVRTAAARAHASLRSEIVSGELGAARLRRRFDEVAAPQRDHVVEEVLGVAYPPLEEAAPEPELIAYTPSGYDEIVHAFDVTGLSSGDRLLDIGAGVGKVVLLASLLGGATSVGVERDAALVDMARMAAADLHVRNVRFDHGDARELGVVEADVVFMYLPFTGKTLDAVMARVAQSRPRRLCAGALDRGRHPDLVPAGPARSWLHIYEWG